MNTLDRFGRGLSDMLNPILIKELRQAVQSNLVTSILALFLTICLGAVLLFIMSGSFGSIDTLTYSTTLARRTFVALFAILMFTTIVFVPIYAAARMTFERQQSNLDLIYITTLSPWAIVRGKVVSSVVLVFLFFTLCTPFISFSYLLRGLDLPSIFFVLGMGFLMVLLAVQFSIMIACLPTSIVLKVILGLALVAALIGFAIGNIAWGEHMVRRGVWASFGGSNGIWELLMIFLAICTISGFFNTLTVLFVSPVTSNRVLPFRIYMTGIWVLWFIISLFWIDFGSPTRKALANEGLQVWFIMSIVVLLFPFFFSTSEREEPTPRVRNKIPQSSLKRILIWPFYSGSANAFVWAVGMMVLSTIIFLFMYYTFGQEDKRFLEREFVRVVALGLYSIAYIGTALLFRRIFNIRAEFTWVANLIVLAIVFIIPTVMIFMFSQNMHHQFFSIWPYGSIIDLFDSRLRIATHFWTALIWSLVVVLANITWFTGQMKAFKPLKNA